MHTPGAVSDDTSHQHSSVPVSAGVAATSSTWPPETDLVVTQKKKVNLCLQQPAIRVLLQDAIDIVRVSLMFTDAFPNANATLELVQDSVTTAAKRYRPGTSPIYERLKSDYVYKSQMATVVRTIFSNNYLLKSFAAPCSHLNNPR